MFERICIVTTFLEEAADDGSGEQSTGQDNGSGQRRRTGSREGVDGPEGGPNAKRSSLPDGSVQQDGEASPLTPADRTRSQRRSSLSNGQPAAGGAIGEPGSYAIAAARDALNPAANRGSLPLLAQPRTPSQPTSLGLSSRRQARSRNGTISSATWNQTWPRPGMQEMASAERTKRIMQALCRHAYQGVRQVERHVFSGDERPLTPNSPLAAAAGAAAGGPASASGNAATTNAAAPGAGGAEAPIGEDGLDANPPTSARALDGETE